MEQAFGNEYSSKFDWFVRDFLSVRMGKIPKIGYVYDAFKSYVQDSEASRHVADVLEDVYAYSKHYVNIALNKETDPDLLQAFKNISRLKVDVSYPFLLPVYDDYISGRITKEELLDILTLIESYVFRRAICGIPTNSLNKTFAILYKSIDKDNYVESVMAQFQLMDGYQRYPTDVEFENELRAKDVYNLRARNYLLGKLENFDRRELVNVEEYTIEHVMPQNPNLSPEWRIMLGENWKEIHDRYLHTLGNLTLTRYNSELSDRPYTEKKTIAGGFNDSPVRLNEYLRNSDVWNEGSIRERAIQLAELAKSVWPAPDLSEETLSAYRKEEPSASSSSSLEDHKHLEGEMLELYEHLRKRILNLGPTVTEEFTKLYIAFQTTSNFVEVVPQKSKLKLYLNIDFADIVDPNSLGRDVSGIGSWGSGDVEVNLSNLSELEYVMDLVQQAFDAQTEGI